MQDLYDRILLMMEQGEEIPLRNGMRSWKKKERKNNSFCHDCI